MGMSARIYVDGDAIYAYKCIEAWSDIIDPIKKKDISVAYYYEDGYGSYDLYIYIRNIITEKIFTIVHKEPENDDNEYHEELKNAMTINLEKYGPEKLEIYICIKGYRYTNMGPFFKSEPIKWFKNTIENKQIRDNYPSSFKNIEKDKDIFDFVESYMKIENGEFVFESPISKKNDFTIQEQEHITNFLKRVDGKYYTRNNTPPTAKFIQNLIEGWNQL